MTQKLSHVTKISWWMDAGHYVSSGYCVMTMCIKNSNVKKWLSGVTLQLPVLVAIYLYTIIVTIFTIACKFAMENISQVKSNLI